MPNIAKNIEFLYNFKLIFCNLKAESLLQEQIDGFYVCRNLQDKHNARYDFCASSNSG